MIKATKVLMIGLASAALFCSAAQAGTGLLAARLVADDVPALAKFYQTVFDMKEVNRFDFPNGLVEIMLNFGETVEAAKANRSTQVVISKKSPNDGSDAVPHLVFNVSDMAATVKAFKESGGRFERDPVQLPNSKTLITVGTDPVGNHIELIYLENRK